MASFGRAVSEFAQNFVAFVLMIVLAIISFFFTVFVVDVGASLAGHPGDDFVVLSAALLVSAATIAGGISPLGFLSGPAGGDVRRGEDGGATGTEGEEEGSR